MGRAKHARRPWSLVWRVAVLTGLATTLILALFAVGIAHSVERHFVALDLATLNAYWSSLQSQPAPPLSARDVQQPESHQARRGGHGAVVFWRYEREGQSDYGTAGPELVSYARGFAPQAALNEHALWQVQLAGGHWRGVVLGDAQRRLLLALDMQVHEDYLVALHRALALVAALMGLAGLLVAGLAARLGLAPLRQLSQRVAAIHAENLQERLDWSQQPAELRAMIDALNSMIGRIEADFRRLQELSADIAHEWRTPLTVLTTQTQVMLARPRTAEDYQELLYSLLEEFERLGRVVDDMLLLAQSAQPLGAERKTTIALADEVRGLFEFLQVWAEEQGVSFEFSGQAPALAANGDMLRRAISNLLVNAVQHTQRGGCVSVRLQRQGDEVALSVENPGIAMAAELTPQLFGRFVRGGTPVAGHRGSGLGLAITQAIAQAHGGHCTATSAQGVNRFTLLLPIVQG